MKHLIYIILLLLVSVGCYCEEPLTPNPSPVTRTPSPVSNPHEVRIGWGDMMFESTMQYEFTHIGKPNARIDYLTGHFFAEYQYHWLPWLASGMQVDFFQMGWHDRRELRLNPDAHEHNYYNLSFLPTVRFTWFHSTYVNLYTAAFVGLCINGGTEQDPMTEKYTLCYPAFGLTMIGCQIGKDGFYGTVEWGGLSALKDVNSMVMVSARILSVGFAYQFNTPNKKKGAEQ